MTTYIRLLGRPAVRKQAGWLELPVGKTSALIYYLAYQEDWVSRDELLYLFWPDSPEHDARQNLRPLLSKIRRFDFVEQLDSDKTRLRWQVETDVQLFKAGLAKKQWSEAWQVYQGELLFGFSVPQLPEFESWLALERSELHTTYREAALSFASELEATGRPAEAAEVLARLYSSDKFDEPVLQRYLVALHNKGERNEAVKTYEAFSQLLKKEFDSEPDVTTQNLIGQIQLGEVLAKVAVAVTTHQRLPHTGDTVPLPTTLFIGREDEKSTLIRELSEVNCRLLSIVGPGGIGKTRLAAEVATELKGTFRDSVFFVACETVTTTELVVAALASALNFSFFGRQDPKVQLLDYLRTKKALLVFDNLEHLLADLSLITDILKHAPAIKILTTTRECLNLQAEWVFDLGGMAYPERVSEHVKVQDFDAVQLFVQAAKRARADFMPVTDELQAIIRICHWVEGMPLALELAASWVRLLSVEEIATHLEEGDELLETSIRDLPARHQSIHAVFEHSWQLLLPREQVALRKLSVFRGGFSLAAAESVTATSLPVLLALVNKSFLRRSTQGRFSQHPLIWQFAQQRSQTHKSERDETEALHSAYFIEFLRRREGTLHTSKERQSIADIEADIDNIEVAWYYAAAHGHQDWLDTSLNRLCWFYFSQGWFNRGLIVLRAAQTHISETSLLQGRCLQWIGAFLFHSGKVEEGIALLKKSVEILELHNAKAYLAFALRGLGTAYSRLGAVYTDSALEAFFRALELYRELGDAEGTTMALMAPAYQAKDALTSEQYLNQGIHCATEAGLPRPLAMILDTVAELHLYRTGNYAAAKKAIEESLTRFLESGEVGYRIAALDLYLTILITLGENELATTQAKELLTLMEILKPPNLAVQAKSNALGALGRIAYLSGEFSQAQLYAENCQGLRVKGLMYRRFEPLMTLVRIAIKELRISEAQRHIDKAWKALKDFPMYGSFAHAADKLQCLAFMGELAILQSRFDDARDLLSQALRLAREWDYLPPTLQLLVTVSKLLYLYGNKKQVTDILSLVATHAAATPEAKSEALALLKEQGVSLDTTRMSNNDPTLQLNQLVAALLGDASQSKGLL